MAKKSSSAPKSSTATTPNAPAAPADKIAFVGVGRMGANMARRLKDCGYNVTAVYDANAPLATALAAEIGAKAVTTLAAATAAAEVIFTVVTDDAAQLAVFPPTGDSLLVHATGKVFVNCATLTPRHPRRGLAPRQKSRRRHPRRLHGFVDSPSPQRHPLPHVRRLPKDLLPR